MSEKIRLRVPSKPAADEVSHGNFHAELTPGKVITVDNRRFAEWLVNEWGCAEIDKPETSSKSKAKRKSAAKSEPVEEATETTEETEEDSPACCCL